MLTETEAIETNLIGKLDLFQQITHALRWILRDTARCVRRIFYKTIDADLQFTLLMNAGDWMLRPKTKFQRAETRNLPGTKPFCVKRVRLDGQSPGIPRPDVRTWDSRNYDWINYHPQP